MRAYFLTDAKSGNTLLAQMLPMTTSQPLELQSCAARLSTRRLLGVQDSAYAAVQ